MVKDGLYIHRYNIFYKSLNRTFLSVFFLPLLLFNSFCCIYNSS